MGISNKNSLNNLVRAAIQFMIIRIHIARYNFIEFNALESKQRKWDLISGCRETKRQRTKPNHRYDACGSDRILCHIKVVHN